MYRTTVIRRALMAAVAVAFAAGCTAQAAGTTGIATPPSAPTGGAPGSPSADSKPSEPATSPSPTVSESPGSPGKVLMAEGTENEQVRELQARLKQLDHFKRSPTAFYGSMTTAAVKGFQEQRSLATSGTVDETTWEQLVAMTRKPTGSELRPPTTYELDTPDQRCMTGRVMCISKESRTLAWMVDGKVVSAMDVRFGSENTPTREGTFSVGWKARKWDSTIYHTPMPYAMFFSGGQAVHYSSDFAARGYSGASHGCVNVRDERKLSALFDEVKVGDKVVVYW
ncbi:L,D-transpeptidase family protein [Streptomyces sp. NPDC051219]|uniref:L,D-transpeptidase family protein n=1 Tax=Streptomyces sp. NPDC051219 TaxID=3155283 RepID=UPI00341D8B35